MISELGVIPENDTDSCDWIAVWASTASCPPLETMQPATRRKAVADYSIDEACVLRSDTGSLVK